MQTKGRLTIGPLSFTVNSQFVNSIFKFKH